MLVYIIRPPFSEVRIEHLCECGRIVKGQFCYEGLLALVNHLEGLIWVYGGDLPLL